MQKTFRNCTVKDGDGKLVITIDLGQDIGPSKSGKNTNIGSTGGNQKIDVEGLGEVFLGVNCYKPR